MSDANNQRIIYSNPLKHLKIWRGNRFGNATSIWHYHHELEIVILIKGNLSVIIKNEVFHLKPGSAFIIGSYEPHYLYQTDECIHYVVCQFDVFEYLESELINLKYLTEAGRLFTQINYLLKENPMINHSVFNCVYEIYNEDRRKQKGYGIAIHSLIHKIILLLLRNDYKSVLNINYSVEFQRLLPALDYIDSHIEDRISMEEVCAVVNMSYYHFGKCFKKVTGKNFKNYVNYKKILHAERLLLTTDLTVMEIAEAVGIYNKTNFYKTFHAQNSCTPSEFKKKTGYGVIENQG